MAHSNIAHTVLVLSGKGGVGKSTISVQLALSLVAQGLKVGLLDVDLCGPSIPRMLGIEASVVHQSDAGWIPVQAAENLHVMSLAFLLTNREDAVVWRGPKKTSMIEQFISNVCWGQLDYLVVDTPPGTSDEHLTVVEKMALLNVDGAVLVTTPQEIAVADVRKEASFCKKTNLRILGIVENMSGFVCPHCSDCTNIFAAGGGEGLAAQLSVPFLGRVPIEPRLTSALEEGSNFQTIFATSATAAACRHICDVVITSTGGNPAAPVPVAVAAAGGGAAAPAAAPAAGDGLP